MLLKSKISNLKSPAASWSHLRHSAFCIQHSAFSLIEVLFAMMILGIGFIMLAAMFPVAIEQTQRTVDETAAAAVTSGALEVFQVLPTPLTAFPDTPSGALRAVDTGIPAFIATKGNRVNSADPRYAWLPIYLRETGKAARFAVVALRSRNAPDYPTSPNVLHDDNSFKEFTADFVYAAAGSTATLTAVDSDDAGVLVEGALVFRSIAAGGNQEIAVYELGEQDASDVTGKTYALAPGMTLSDGTEAASSVSVFVIGRGLRDPSAAYNATSNPYEGPSQAISFAKGSR